MESRACRANASSVLTLLALCALLSGACLPAHAQEAPSTLVVLNCDTLEAMH